MIAIDRANLLAGHAVAYATAFLDGRHDADQLLHDAGRLHADMLGLDEADMLGLDDPAASEILVPVRLLAVAMARTAIAARAHGAPGTPPNALARLDRWRQVTASLVELVRRESRELPR